jgi:hypothetical protein
MELSPETKLDTIKSGVMKEILATPFVKELICNALKSAAIENDPPLVRTLLWEDPEVSLAFLSTLPHLVNRCSGGTADLGREISEKFSPKLLTQYLAAIVDEIDGERIKDCADVWGNLIFSLWEAEPIFRQAVANGVSRNLPILLGTGLTAASRLLNETSRKDPRAVSRFVSRTLDNMDAGEVEKAAKILLNAVCDQKARFPSVRWFWTFFRERRQSRNHR